MNRTMMLVTVLALTMGWPLPQAYSAAVATDAATAGKAALANRGRPADDRDQDAQREPAEILAFLGAAPGMERLHRIDPAVVKRDFKAAGFALEAQSDVLAHPDDDRTLGVFDPKIRGRTDQFVMKFRRPGP